jgi:hypothetical protein
MDLSTLLLVGFAAARAIMLAETFYFKPRRSPGASGSSMPGYVRPWDRRSVRVDFPRLSHRINVLTPIE